MADRLWRGYKKGETYLPTLSDTAGILALRLEPDITAQTLPIVQAASAEVRVELFDDRAGVLLLFRHVRLSLPNDGGIPE